MKICNLRCLALICVSFPFCPNISAQTRKMDPVTQWLTSQGFSNVPLANQNDAQLGALIWVPNGGGENNFESADPTVPAPRSTPRGVYIPGGKVEDLVDAGAEASFLGFNPSAEFQNYQSLSYSAMQLASQELTTGQIREIMKKESYTDKLAMTHIVFSKKRSVLGITVRTGINDTAAQYIIGKVFTTTASGDITSASGTSISAKSGGDIPACKYLSPPENTPSDAGDNKNPGANPPQKKKDDAAPTGAVAAQDAAAQTGTTPATPAKPGQAAQPATNKPQGVVAQLGQDAAQIAGEVTGGKVDPAKAVKATTSTVASGGVHYCRKDAKTVHFEAEHPYPVAMYLYQLFVNDDKTWLPTHATVAFIPAKPDEQH